LSAVHIKQITTTCFDFSITIIKNPHLLGTFHFPTQAQQQPRMSNQTIPIPKSAFEEALRMLLKARIRVGPTIAEVDSCILAVPPGAIENHYLATKKLDGLSQSNETDPWRELDSDLLLLKLASFLKTLPSPTATPSEVRDHLVSFPCEKYAVDELDQHFLPAISRVDITGADIQAMSYCELRLYLLDAGFKGSATEKLLPAYVDAATEVCILKQIQMLVFKVNGVSIISLERKRQTANTFGKRANPNRFTLVDIWFFFMMAIAPFCMFHSAYRAKSEKSVFICTFLGALYCFYWVFVLLFGLERARIWNIWEFRIPNSWTRFGKHCIVF
jgi:hypothetical protein